MKFDGYRKDVASKVSTYEVQYYQCAHPCVVSPRISEADCGAVDLLYALSSFSIKRLS